MEAGEVVKKGWMQRYREVVWAHCIDQNIPEDTLEYWQNHLFARLMAVMIPLSLLTVVPGVIYSVVMAFWVLAGLNVLSFTMIVVIIFARRVSVRQRKFWLLAVAYLAGGYLLFYVGFRGPGFLYLYAACIFGILILPASYAFFWSWLNVLVCLLFAGVIHWDLSPLPEVNEMPVAAWLAIAVNLWFLSFLTSALLPSLLRGLSESLKRQRELQQSLEVANRSLTEKNSDLEQFAHVASHDLQEPLRTISSFLSLVDKRYGATLDDKGRQYIGFAVQGARRMRTIIQDLLEFSRAGKSLRPLEEVSLGQVAHEVCELHQRQIEELKATVTIEELPSVHTDKASVRQILQNLMSNALKYVPMGTMPVIRVFARVEDTGLVIGVQDNGIGIDQEYFDKVFVMFQRLHPIGEYEGTGMGLAIVRKNVERLGGRTWVESEMGKGSIFYFTLPLGESVNGGR